MTAWTLVKALLLKDLIGFLISLCIAVVFGLGCWFVVWRDEAWEKRK